MRYEASYAAAAARVVRFGTRCAGAGQHPASAATGRYKDPDEERKGGTPDGE